MRAKKKMEVIEQRPVYESKEAELEALSRGALKLALFEENYRRSKESNSNDTATA